MTPDTATLRALANGVSRLGAPQEFTSEEDFAGLGMGRAERRYYAAVTPDTVRALCDAADEVERLTEEVASLRTLRMEINQGFGGPATIKVWRDNVLRFNGVDLSALMERDASRTAHAALVAELRALAYRWQQYDDRARVDAAALLRLANRHAPTTGATS